MPSFTDLYLRSIDSVGDSLLGGLVFVGVEVDWEGQDSPPVLAVSLQRQGLNRV